MGSTAGGCRTHGVGLVVDLGTIEGHCEDPGVGYSWLFDKGSFLVNSGDHIRCQGSNPGSNPGRPHPRANALPASLLLGP